MSKKSRRPTRQRRHATAERAAAQQQRRRERDATPPLVEPDWTLGLAAKLVIRNPVTMVWCVFGPIIVIVLNKSISHRSAAAMALSISLTIACALLLGYMNIEQSVRGYKRMWRELDTHEREQRSRPTEQRRPFKATLRIRQDRHGSLVSRCTPCQRVGMRQAARDFAKVKDRYRGFRGAAALFD